MTALWLAPDEAVPSGSVRPALKLVGADGYFEGEDDWSHSPLPLVSDRALRAPIKRRTSAAVRRRRTLLAVIGLLLIGLALPLSGTGGDSHPTGSASAGILAAGTYTVQPGDTLWTIAERVAPDSDPRPLVAKLAAESGSDTVVPGERLTLP
jgi:nucleoid-associated protein YgaU